MSAITSSSSKKRKSWIADRAWVDQSCQWEWVWISSVTHGGSADLMQHSCRRPSCLSSTREEDTEWSVFWQCKHWPCLRSHDLILNRLIRLCYISLTFMLRVAVNWCVKCRNRCIKIHQNAGNEAPDTQNIPPAWFVSSRHGPAGEVSLTFPHWRWQPWSLWASKSATRSVQILLISEAPVDKSGSVSTITTAKCNVKDKII